MNRPAKPSPDHQSTNTNAPEPGLNARAYHQTLEAVSLVYFVSPFAIFVLGWLRPVVGIPLFVLLCAATFVAFRTASSGNTLDEGQSEWIPSGRGLAFIAMLVFAVVACTGIGGFTFQFFDYAFYDAVLKDLITYSWPLGYAEAGPGDEPLHVVFYAAYWLPAALVGHFAGWNAAYLFQYIWAACGMLLIILWFLRLAQSRSLLLVLMVLFFGGLDIAGRLLTEPIGASGVSLFGYFAGEFWWSQSYGWLDHWSSNYALLDPGMSEKANGVFFRFYSPISFLVDGPQHLLPGLVGFLMLLHDWWRKQSLSRSVLLWACLPICSVFVTAGAFPFMALAVVEKRAEGLRSFANLAAIPFVVLMIFFYASVQGVEGGRVTGWLWEFQNLSETWHFLALHYIVEFGILALVIPMIRHNNLLPGPLWWLGALTMFLLSPFYRMGEYNDFTTKVIIPAQFVFLLYLAIAILNTHTRRQRIMRAVLVALLCAGAIGPLGNLVRALSFGFVFGAPPLERVRHTNEVEPRILALQAKGDPESVFFRLLAAEPVLQPSEPIRPAAAFDLTGLDEWDPDEYITFVDEEQVSATPGGLRIMTAGNEPLVRLNGVALDTDTIGKVRLRLEVFRDGSPFEDFSVIFQWATPDQVVEAEGEWPFPKWQNYQVWPVLRVVSANSFWRGTAQDVAFYFLVPDAGEELYEVIISEIVFLER